MVWTCGYADEVAYLFSPIATPAHISVVPFSPSLSHSTCSFCSQATSLFFGSSENSVDVPVKRSMTRISFPSEGEPREYVDTVYKARLPFSLGIAEERRGVVMRSLWLLSEVRPFTCSKVQSIYSNVKSFFFRTVMMPKVY